LNNGWDRLGWLWAGEIGGEGYLRYDGKGRNDEYAKAVFHMLSVERLDPFLRVTNIDA
jgi:hypothetical protein